MQKEYLWVGLIILFLNLFTYIPTLQNYIHTPPDRYFWGGSTEYPIDPLGTLYVVQQGYHGHWLRYPPETSTMEGKLTILKFEYLLLGHMARIFGISPLAMYYAGRFILSTITILFLYYFIRHIFASHKERFIALLFSAFATSIIFPNLPLDTSVFLRLTAAAPHYILGTLLFLSSVFILAHVIDRSRNIYYFFISTLLVMIAALVNSPVNILVLLSLPFFLLLMLIQNPQKTKRVHIIVITALYAVCAAVPFLYLRYVAAFWDFNTISITEQIVGYNPMPWQYLLITGMPYLLSLCAIPSIVKRGNTFLKLILPWVIVHPIAVYVVAPLVGMNKGRFFLTPYFVVFAILAVAGMIAVSKTIHRWWPKLGQTTILIAITAITLMSGTFTYVQNMRYLYFSFLVEESFTFGYPKKELMRAIYWLRDNTHENNIILSDWYTGALIPAFAGNKVYTSWWFRLMGGEQMKITYTYTRRFYGGQMNDGEAERFLTTNHIAYVLLRNDNVEEQPLVHGLMLPYPFLKEMFRTNEAVIYAVQ